MALWKWSEPQLSLCLSTGGSRKLLATFHSQHLKLCSIICAGGRPDCACTVCQSRRIYRPVCLGAKTTVLIMQFSSRLQCCGNWTPQVWRSSLQKHPGFCVIVSLCWFSSCELPSSSLSLFVYLTPLPLCAGLFCLPEFWRSPRPRVVNLCLAVALTALISDSESDDGAFLLFPQC